MSILDGSIYLPMFVVRDTREDASRYRNLEGCLASTCLASTSVNNESPIICPEECYRNLFLAYAHIFSNHLCDQALSPEECEADRRFPGGGRQSDVLVSLRNDQSTAMAL